MQIDVLLNPLSIIEAEVRDKIVVVIDVLRSSSTMITALANGAKAIVPSATLGDAGRIALNLDAKVYLLGGEKGGVKIDGYHLGNSPLEYTTETVKGRTIIMHTTNGTVAIIRAKGAKQLTIGSFLNAQTIANFLLEAGQDVLLICGGNKNHVSVEDTLCAGLIIDAVKSQYKKIALGDGAFIAHSLYSREKNHLAQTISHSVHAQLLKSLGFEEDVPYCTQINSHDILPIFDPNTLSIMSR